MIAAIVLAAGSARRFGSDKRFHPVNGVPMLARTLATYRAVFNVVAAVIRPGETEVAALVRDAGCRIVEAPDADLGQSRSLAAGVAALTAGRDSHPEKLTASTLPAFNGLIIGLADMPFVGEDTLRRLAATMIENPDAIARPRCGGRAGNPVGFPKGMFPKLLRLRGDAGARQVVAASEAVVFVDVDDEGVLVDVDRPTPLNGS
ncbi:MAG: nucleotidyltransferase family protein [Gammaproteobacteria bacterium]|nr:nucleotidyltransferase family protein [Gammaproteobacteria bacterium]